MRDARYISSILTSSDGFFIVPDYHRGYVWQTKQVLQLLNDIDNIKLEKADDYLYLGSIYYLEKRYSNNREYNELIDGQQRITTIMLTLKEIIDRVRTDDPKNDNLEKFEMGLFDYQDKNRIRLTSKIYDNNNFFRNYITKGIINRRLSTDINILTSELAIKNAITLIKEYLSDMKIEFWRGFSSKLVERTKVTIIQVSESDDCIQIYNSLNTKGLNLEI